MHNRFSLTVAVACALAPAIFISTPSAAQSAVRLDLPSQSLDAALRALGNQTKTNILFDPASVRNLSAPAVTDASTVEEALAKMLVGSGLTYRFIDARTVTLIPANTALAKKTSLAMPRDGATDSIHLAQASTPDRSVASAEMSIDVEEVVVTARKREERLIDVPQSVSVLSSQDLKKLGATQFRDFADTVPGLSFQTGGVGFNQLSLRGVTTGYDITPSVGNVVDDVPYGSSSAFARGAQLALDVGLFDVDRIEVLRGPQGTLYGASTMGGLIKYVTKRPDSSQFSADLQTGVSSTEQGGVGFNGAMAVNAPLLADKVALRGSAFYSHDGGYIDNVALSRDDVNRANVYGGKLDLLLTPGEALTVRLGVVLQNIERDGTATSDYTLEREPVHRELEQFRLIPESFGQRFRLLNSTIEYDFGKTALTSISSYQTIASKFVVDDSPNLVPVLALCPPFCRSYSAVDIDNAVDTDKFTQEVRLASKNSGAVDWLAGGFFTHEVSTNTQELMLLDAAGQPAPNDLFSYHTPSNYKEYAAFGNLTLRLTEQLDLTGGLRYARNDQAFTQDASGLLILAVPKRRSHANVSTYLANVRYHFSDGATGYIRYATGYRPGGPNAVSVDPLTGEPNAPLSFDADTSRSYEAGYKAQNAARTLGFEVAAYYIDWNDLQQLTTTASGVSYYANAQAGATIKGSELALTARLAGGLTVSGAFAYQDATMSGNEPILGARKGERLPNVPRFTAAVMADYAFAVENLRPSIGLTFRSASDRRASFDNNSTIAQYRLNSYSTFDVRAGLVLGSIDLQCYVRNVFDEQGQMTIPSGVSSLAGPVAVSILQPRTFGITATSHF